MAKASISIVKGKGSMNHNNREFFTENVDQNRTPDNITYKRETLEQAYEKCFGQAVEEYNAKQKRADRRIDGAKGYMEQIRNSKNGEKLFYENVESPRIVFATTSPGSLKVPVRCEKMPSQRLCSSLAIRREGSGRSFSEKET